MRRGRHGVVCFCGYFTTLYVIKRMTNREGFRSKRSWRNRGTAYTDIYKEATRKATTTDDPANTRTKHVPNSLNIRKEGVKLRICFGWFRAAAVEGLCEHGNETLCSMKGGGTCTSILQIEVQEITFSMEIHYTL